MDFTMSFSELMPLAPVMIVALTAIVVMLLIAIKRNHNLVATTSVIGLNLAAFYIICFGCRAVCTCKRNEFVHRRSIYDVVSVRDCGCSTCLLHIVTCVYRNV